MSTDAPPSARTRRRLGRLAAGGRELLRSLPARASEALGAAASLGRDLRDADGRARLRATARRRPWRAALLLAGVALLAALGIAALRPLALPDVPLAEVREGPFSVDVVESGTLDALRSVTYSSSIQSNQAKIVALAPEGRMVKKGDLLILFDAAPFEEEIRKHTALLAQAQADLEKARKDKQLQLLENQENLATARQKVERSQLELQDTQSGKGLLKEDESAASVANAERDLKKAEGQLEDLKPMLAEGFITKLELERAEQQVQKSREDLELARRRHQALLKYGRPLELSQARSDALLTRESARQLESATRYRLEQKDAAIAAAQSRIDEASSKLTEARQQLAHTEVRADVPGIVVYRKVFFGSEQRKPQVGDQVWANQPLLVLPDISKMIVETKIRETDIHKVAENQKVTVRVAAYPDLKLTGHVTLVGTLAQEERDRRGARFFGVTIELDGSDARLRPGMTARVEILVDERPVATYVPLEAVFDRAGRSVAYVAEGGRLVEREVVLGPSNQNFVIVERGLARGERVALVDPREPAPEFAGLPD